MRNKLVLPKLRDSGDLESEHIIIMHSGYILPVCVCVICILGLHVMCAYSCIRASVDTLCRDDTSETSRDPGTKRLLTQRERLARP